MLGLALTHATHFSNRLSLSLFINHCRLYPPVKRSFGPMSLVLKLNHRCFKKIKKKLIMKIYTVYFHLPRFGINYGYKTELYSAPFPDLWTGFFCVCLIGPIFLKTSCQSQNWSTLLSDLMASSILELAVGWTPSVGCTQNVVNFYTSCQGRSPKSMIEQSTLRQKVMTLRGYTRRQRQWLNSRRFSRKSRHFGVIPGDSPRGQQLSDDSFRLNGSKIMKDKVLLGSQRG